MVAVITQDIAVGSILRFVVPAGGIDPMTQARVHKPRRFSMKLVARSDRGLKLRAHENCETYPEDGVTIPYDYFTAMWLPCVDVVLPAEAPA